MSKKVTAVGSKQSAQKNNNAEDLFKKKWTNGHKFFGAQESVAFQQLLQTELNSSDRFEKKKHQMTIPRNPLNGDFTPRDDNGLRVTNPNNFADIKGGILLYDPDNDLEPRPRSERHEINVKYKIPATGNKIGPQEGKYDILGNDKEAKSVVQRVSHFDTVKAMHDNKKTMSEEQADILRCITLEKAKRQQAELERESHVLQKQLEKREKELSYLRSSYNLS